MKLYAGIDLHSNNHVLTIIDAEDKKVFEKRLPNQLDHTLCALKPYQADLQAIAVESTFNWYWLVDGLQEAGYSMRLVNTSAVKQYEGIKHTDDQYDAFWLAHLMRLGILPSGYIYPKEERAVRDLMRKRMQLVQNKTAHVLSLQNQYWRSLGIKLKSVDIQRDPSEAFKQIQDANVLLALESNQAIIQALQKQIQLLEKKIKQQCQMKPAFKSLHTVYGIGDILALTIMLETGDIQRFASVGDYASYCRCVDSKKTSNGKKKGEGNRKNGNQYLAWAYVEAAYHAQRFYEPAKRFFQRKQAKRNSIVATKALAHKLARASFFVMRDQVPFDPTRLFS